MMLKNEFKILLQHNKEYFYFYNKIKKFRNKKHLILKKAYLKLMK